MTCLSLNAAIYKRRHANKIASYNRSYYLGNKAEFAARWADYYAKNRPGLLDALAARRRANPAYDKANNAKRRARLLLAVPAWFGELDALVWDEALDLVALRKAATGIDWNADHMIPLAAKDACGLHVWSNCQVIPARLNRSKRNRLVLVDHREWIFFC